MIPADQRSEDIIELIVQDHRHFQRIFAELESGAHSAEHRRQLVDHLIADVTRHSVAEEQLLYPAARDQLPDGDEVADHEIAEHQKVEEAMKRLEGLLPQEPAFEREVRTVIDGLRHHLEEEESDLLPKIRSASTPQDLAKLGQMFLAAKDGAPTRPHPSTPDTPPANLVIGAGAGIIDKVRDALSGRSV